MQALAQIFDTKWQPEPNSGCHLWCGPTDPKKHGHVYGRIRDQGKLVYAHRYAFEREHGQIGDGLVIDHKCRNTYCVNPQHLEAVTISENVRRGTPKNSKVTHCPKGHPYSGDNLRMRGPTRRRCVACMKIWAADQNRRNRKDIHHGI